MRWLVFGCKYDFVVFTIHLFFFWFCIYIAEEHTRHVGMCFTVAVECVLPYKKHTLAPQEMEETHTTQATG